MSLGAAANWLRKSLNFFTSFSEAEQICQDNQSQGVYIIPAYSGLGAPFWKMKSKAVIQGLSLDTKKEQVVRAVYESMAFQLCAIIEDMQKKSLHKLGDLDRLSFDGGLTQNNFFMQFLADLLSRELKVSTRGGLSAKGCAILAALSCDSIPLEQLATPRKSIEFASIEPSADIKSTEKIKAIYQEWLTRVWAL